MNKNLIINILFFTVLFFAIESVCFGQVTVGTYNHPILPNMMTGTTKVYTQVEIDTKINDLFDSINKIEANNKNQIKALDQKLDSGLKRVEESLNELIKSSIDKLPQRLLTDEVRNSLKTDLENKIMAKVKDYRDELQKQIDKLK